MKKYKLVGSHPVARFYYKGSHSHPIRRTVLIIESNDNIIRGYEVREGSTIRLMAESPIKSYSRSRISKYNQIGASNHRKPGPRITTLKRSNLYDYLFAGA